MRTWLIYCLWFRFSSSVKMRCPDLLDAVSGGKDELVVDEGAATEVLVPHVQRRVPRPRARLGVLAVHDKPAQRHHPLATTWCGGVGSLDKL